MTWFFLRFLRPRNNVNSFWPRLPRCLSPKATRCVVRVSGALAALRRGLRPGHGDAAGHRGSAVSVEKSRGNGGNETEKSEKRNGGGKQRKRNGGGDETPHVLTKPQFGDAGDAPGRGKLRATRSPGNSTGTEK